MMTLARSLFAQLRSSWSAILLVLAVSAALLGGVLLWASWWEIPVGDLTRDPANILGCSPHIGFLSQLGIFFWSASATICLFSA